ncbi:MAG: hypothetical protein ABSH21_08700 [Verrucomicrobiia bacterium]
MPSTTNPKRRFPTAGKALLPDKFETLVAEMRAAAAAIGKQVQLLTSGLQFFVRAG